MAAKNKTQKQLSSKTVNNDLEKDYLEIMNGFCYPTTQNTEPFSYASVQFEKLSFYPPSSTTTVTADLSL